MRVAILPAVLFVVLATTGCGGKKKEVTGCPPPPSTASAGAAQISARAIGKSYSKLVVLHATEKAGGAPVHGGKVSIRAEMACPHFMPMYTKSMQETSTGTYKAGYSLVMPGKWTFYFVLREKNGNATTSALPVTVKLGG